jgi:hypothetical protein
VASRRGRELARQALGRGRVDIEHEHLEAAGRVGAEHVLLAEHAEHAVAHGIVG